MKHKQIIDHIGCKPLPQAIDEDLARLVIHAMSRKKSDSIVDISEYVLPRMLARWNCVLLMENCVAQYYKEKVVLTLAVMLHKYGMSDDVITTQAIAAIDKLNDDAVLSDAFYKKADKIKNLLRSMPLELKRKPKLPARSTFFRTGDIVSIQLDKKYYIAYVHELTSINEAPIIEFYDAVFTEIPKIEQLHALKAKGETLNDGRIYVSQYAIYGMKYNPDLAMQIHLIHSDNASDFLPDNNALEESIGEYTVRDLFSMQKTINDIFG